MSFWAGLASDGLIGLDSNTISELGGLWPKRYTKDAIRVSEMLGLKDHSEAWVPVHRKSMNAKHRIPTLGLFFSDLQFLAELVRIILDASSEIMDSMGLD
ncbi:MAG: hypothetical protein M1823_000253 [Watsoniomyces obsoletus]|nr:MAG: hypothetical protein M1823_000253 [Watsoniomyces obsoletus]